MVGLHLMAQLLARGERVIALVRPSHQSTMPPGVEVRPWSADDLVAPLAGADGVVNLVGQPIFARRWTAARKRDLIATRVGAVLSVVGGIQQAQGSIRTFISASAVEYAGDTGEAEVDESAPPGTGFLATVSAQWEPPALAATELGARVVILRNGLVLGRDGGLFAALLPLFRRGLGGPIGSGRQWMPWIHVDDTAHLILHALDLDDIRGPLIVTSPHPVRNREFAHTFGQVLGKPAWVPLLSPVARLVWGERADLLLASHRMRPKKAEETGFSFRFPDLTSALRDLVKTAQ
jgi:uncharacterized protein (TIGR01777 family)